VKIETAAKSLICNQEGKILLLVRSDTDSHAPGRYDFPGGGVDSGEDVIAAASRELYEEAGIILPPEKLVLAYARTDLSPKGEKSINRVFFIGKTSQTEIKLSYEHSDCIWVSLDEAIQMYDHNFYGPAMKYIRTYNLLENLRD
jgi:8-oxo-dGTP pyrophosphatase MutT (NUDIX family)